MADCAEMQKGDTFVCKNCGLELQVMQPCTCGSGGGEKCTVPLNCCNQEMTKK